MTRTIALLASASLALSLGVLCAGVAARAAPADAQDAPSLDALGAALAGAGLRQRSDVDIEINQRDVARGFSRPGCDGLLLVAVLPRTAQGWRHIAPQLDLSAFRVSYAYDGILYERLPRLARLRDRLLAELAGRELPPQQRVVALAERGECALVPAAAPLLAEPAPGAAAPNANTEFSRSVHQG
jgi:hypothetical protein